MKKWPVLIVVLAVVSSFALGLSFQSPALLPYINQSFLFGLVLLMAGCAVVVTRSGFFTIFLRGFQQLKSFFFRKPRLMDSDLVRGDDPVFAQKKEAAMRAATTLFLSSGTGMIVFSLVLTCFYYL
ncbi:hypothetical protein BAG01nite_19820 [Brevibacillus agri]|uniref:DUF3899 domain-containing protein n=1 Tax=Brevibacillus agri TaxID=51101 RepID=A0A3M8BA04_9BACL|nr:DUF3899 domain-containing protein [Brevibacillus agri]MBY0053459.1 DUF3899 domain-containing protein [Brevibacillus agri]MDN4093898.1 DUF3899 domain-containing protein [Brevibacillus agri]MDR9505495.1 DUF3899 domain-containing protein [Brevibacillus agri]MED1642990.1 DUF3899 domain-containing protein [Brevibacillus agri]MED1656229.1 DUF3899 domain-containing protein [Brevibacillus agri]